MLDFDPQHMRFSYRRRDNAPPPDTQVKLEEYDGDDTTPF